MKKLRITVNGKVYDVTVELLEEEEQGNGLGAAKAPACLPPAATPSRTPAAAPPAPARTPGKRHDPDTLAAPLAGTIQKVFVRSGEAIEAKAPVCLMEAMKMETYIYAPRTGQVVEVCARPGEPVQAGDPLLRYAPEA